MYTAPALLDVPPMATPEFPGGPHLSQSMNHMSFPGGNHKLDSFYHHVLLTDKMYNTDSLPW